MSGETLNGLLKMDRRSWNSPGLEKPGLMPGSFWNISLEKAGRIILHMGTRVLLRKPPAGIRS